MRFSN